MIPFGPRQDALRAEVREFVEGALRPHADAWEAAGSFPDEVFGWLAERGWLGIKYPRELGGLGLGWLDEAVLVEELSRCGSGGVAAGIGAHIGIATPPVWRFGTPEQHERWLAPAIRGETIGALAITEPDAGSDVASVRTRAVKVDGGWLVSGAKTYITNGVRAGFYVTAVRTTPEGGHHGMSFLVVEPGEGLVASPLAKLGWRASDTAEIALDEVFVPDDHLLGDLDRGFVLIMANFQWERLAMSLGAIGAQRAALERTTAALGSSSTARARLAERWTALEAGAALTYATLARFARGEDVVREVTMAKLHTQRASVDTIDACLQELGLAGYAGALSLERSLRDARLGPIGGGTDEIMREILGRMLVA